MNFLRITEIIIMWKLKYMNDNISKKAIKHVKLTKTLNVSLFTKAIIILAIVAIVLHAVLFTTIPGLHDRFHELRHSLMVIPCH